MVISKESESFGCNHKLFQVHVSVFVYFFNTKNQSTLNIKIDIKFYLCPVVKLSLYYKRIYWACRLKDLETLFKIICVQHSNYKYIGYGYQTMKGIVDLIEVLL